MPDGELENSLVILAVTRDVAAYQKLLLRVDRLLLSFVNRHVPVEMARVVHPEDVVQDVLLAGWQGIHELRDQTFRGFKSWMLGLTRHQ